MAKYKTKNGVLTTAKPIKDKTTLDIIKLLGEVFPNCSGFYIPPQKRKIRERKNRKQNNKK